MILSLSSGLGMVGAAVCRAWRVSLVMRFVAGGDLAWDSGLLDFGAAGVLTGVAV